MTRDDKKFPILLGFIDGILTAIILCTGKFIEKAESFDLSFAFRVSMVSFVTGIFVFFVAKYAELRGHIVHAEKQLSLTSIRKLQSKDLHMKTLYNSIIDSVISGGCGFAGAFLPLFVAAIDPYSPWITLSVALFTLGTCGFILGRMVGKSPLVWALEFILGGIAVILIGIKLHIIT